MKPETINQEILLFTNSNFCNRPFCGRNSNYENSENRSSMEELEKACWDGMLYELLPELFNNSQRNTYIWKTASGINFLGINMGPHPTTMEKKNSLDPYFFLHEGNKEN